MAVAIAGVQLLESYAGLDLSRSIHVGADIEWGGAIIGGLMFGFGMGLVGTCGFGTLLRLGGGDFRALLTLVMGLAAAMTLRGSNRACPRQPDRPALIQLAGWRIATAAAGDRIARSRGIGRSCHLLRISADLSGDAPTA
jgi:uncharacterized membrane protein YedE/YeeE